MLCRRLIASLYQRTQRPPVWHPELPQKLGQKTCPTFAAPGQARAARLRPRAVTRRGGARYAARFGPTQEEPKCAHCFDLSSTTCLFGRWPTSREARFSHQPLAAFPIRLRLRVRLGFRRSLRLSFRSGAFAQDGDEVVVREAARALDAASAPALFALLRLGLQQHHTDGLDPNRFRYFLFMYLLVCCNWSQRKQARRFELDEASLN